jgi:hypothetical protein
VAPGPGSSVSATVTPAPVDAGSASIQPVPEDPTVNEPAGCGAPPPVISQAS